MTLRLILFIIAMVIIAWIIWDHNKKQVKTNKYVEYQPLENFFARYFKIFASRKTKKKNSYQSQFATKSAELTRSNALSYDQHEYKYEDDDDEDQEYQEQEEGLGQEDSRDVLYEETHTSQSHDEVSPFVVSLYIKAKDKNNPFTGDELLQALVSVGCRYGEMNIFHRHEKTSGQGDIMFSVASMVNPGTFQIDNMHDFKTPGLILFFTAPGTLYEPTIIYDLMLKTAYKLAKFLDAEILDSNREVLSQDTVNQVKIKLGQYEMIG